MPPRILVVDDDRDLLDMLRYVFQRDGFQVTTATDGEVALRAFQADPPDLVLMDLLMPRYSGLEVLQQIRRDSQVPVLILTCLGDEDHTVNALEIGADDYVAKPFRLRELRARVKALLRRAAAGNNGQGSHPRPLLVGDVSLNPKTREVNAAGHIVKLTPTEFSLLQYLMVNHDRIVRLSDITANVWGFDAEVNDELVRVNISRLRHKIEADPASPKYIINVPGVGYRFVSTPPTES